MKISKESLRQIIKEALQTEQAASAEDADKDITTDELAGLSLPPLLKKLLDPDITPVKFQKIDQMLDESNNVNHQAFAIAAFTLSYAEMDKMLAKQMLTKAAGFVSKIVEAREKAKAK